MLFQISEQPIDIAKARQSLHLAQCGGFVSFEGWVRNHHQGKAVEKLSYSAYTAMAEKEGEKIMRRALAEFEIEAALCIHRVGELQIGDLAVWIGVSAQHRSSAFEACRFIIDALKGDVPIWKHEFYQDGSKAWTLNHHCS